MQRQLVDPPFHRKDLAEQDNDRETGRQSERERDTALVYW